MIENSISLSSSGERFKAMRDTMFAYEPYIRLGAFGGVFVVMAIWEFIGPRRKQAIGRGWRWPNNLGVVVVNTLLVRLVFPTTAVGLALVAEARGWGLFNAVRASGLGRRRCLGRPPRPRDLSPARPVPCRAGAVAAAPHASRRPRIRRDAPGCASTRSRSCCRC